MNKQGLDKYRDKPSPWLTDLGHDRGSDTAFWGIRRKRSILSWRVKGRGNSGRLQREGDEPKH